MGKGIKNTSNWFIYLLVGTLLATAFLPTIRSNIKGMEGDTTNFSSGEIAILGVIGLLIVVGFLYKVMKSTGI